MNLYEAFAQGRERGTERRTKRTLAEYVQPALGGDQQALGQIYSVDPDAGYKVQGMARQQREQDYGDMVRVAQYYQQTGDPNAYGVLREQASRLGPQFAGLPATIDTDEDRAGSMKFAEAIAQSFGGSQGGVGVQSTFVDAQGNRVALMRDGSTQIVGKAAPTTQVIQGADGYYTVDKATGRAAPVVMGGAPHAAAQAPPLQFVGQDGKPVNIDPSLPPEVQRSIAQNEGAWANAPQGATAQLPPSASPAQQIRPYQAPPSYIDQRKLAIDERELQLKEQQQAQQADIRARQQQAREEEARRKAAQAQRVPEIDDVERGIDRIDAALKAIEDNTVFDGGPLDARFLAATKEGQELIAATGAIQNSMSSLTRVPGMGSQSDLEAKLAALRFPSLEMNPQTNRATLENLRKFIADLRAARGAAPSAQQQRPAPRQQPAPPPRRAVLPSQAAQPESDDDLVNKYLSP